MSSSPDNQLWIVSGKGGVGKTAVSAALGRAFAAQGLRTLVCEVNAQERVARLLGHPEVGPELKPLGENLWAVNVRPQEAMREYALMVLRFETVYRAVFENRFVRTFLRFIPSLQELVVLGKILFHVRERLPDGRPRFDRVVMDAPATGHAITFLSVPQVLLDTVPPGPMAQQAEWMRDLLVDPEVTRMVLVTLPEEMPINETIELHAALRDSVKVRAAAVVLNMFIGPRFEPGDVAKLDGPLAAIASTHLGRQQDSQAARARLERTLGVPVLTVPRLFTERFGPAEIDQMASHLTPLWGRP